MFRIICLFLFWLLSCYSLAAQELMVPSPEALREKSDYPRYQETFLKSVDWLLEQGLDAEGRASVNAFVLAWVSGTDAFHIELKSYVMDLTRRNPDLLMVFLGSWGKFALQHPEEKTNQLVCNQYALRQLLYFYEKASPINKDKDLDRLLRWREKGKLNRWLKKQL